MKKIVVVDDQPVLTGIYKAKFSTEGFNVEVASDGEQALDVIKRTEPDLVLLDLMLPKISGIEVLKQLRANRTFEAMPVVVFSNAAHPGAIEDAGSRRNHGAVKIQYEPQAGGRVGSER